MSTIVGTIVFIIDIAFVAIAVVAASANTELCLKEALVIAVRTVIVFRVTVEARKLEKEDNACR